MPLQATRLWTLVEQRVDVGAELPGIDRGRARKRSRRRLRGNELAPTDRHQLSDLFAVASNDEGLTAPDRSDDRAALVTEFGLTDSPLHNRTVAGVRQMSGGPPVRRAPGLRFDSDARAL